jgi:hypothetical protein
MRVLLLALALTGASPEPPKAVIEAVKAQLKDPDSAQFKGIVQSGPSTYCGWVNAKNGFGGYSGFQLFYDANGAVAIVSAEYIRLMERYQAKDASLADKLALLAPCRSASADN